jgi:parallel beta-helix repeat protein
MMKRAIEIITIIISIFLLLNISGSVNSQALNILKIDINDNTLIIADPNGKGDYKSIQQAINNAQSGSTILIKSGEYTEIIDIIKKISLIGEDKDTTIINPISLENKYAIRIRASEVYICNLSISNGGPGIYTSGINIMASDVTIEDCNFYNNPIGVTIWTSDNIIRNCNFWECSDEGIALLGTPYSQCDNNQIINCNFYNNCDGIELQYSSGNIIRDCQFYNNSHTGIDAITSSNNNNIISNCNIYDNKVHGIYFSASSYNQIINCYVSNNQDGNIIQRKNCFNNIIKTQTLLKIRSSLKEKLAKFLDEFLDKGFLYNFASIIKLHFSIN